jgi:hypothetical protein
MHNRQGFIILKENFMMSKAEIFAGICGFNTTVQASMDGDVCRLAIDSQCEAIQRMAADLTQVEPFREISFRRNMPQTMEAAIKYCKHAACPVAVGIIKVVEVESGLALPADVTIKLERTGNSE